MVRLLGISAPEPERKEEKRMSLVNGWTKPNAQTQTHREELRVQIRQVTAVLHALPGGHAFWRPETKIACDL